VGTERNPVGVRALVAVEGRESAVVVSCVPEGDLTAAGGCERAPVGAERNLRYGALVAVEGRELAVIVDCGPEDDRALAAGKGERASVGAERNPVRNALPAVEGG